MAVDPPAAKRATNRVQEREATRGDMGILRGIPRGIPRRIPRGIPRDTRGDTQAGMQARARRKPRPSSPPGGYNSSATTAMGRRARDPGHPHSARASGR
jgi:hypothetical protein